MATSKECRELAQRCIEVANETTDAEQKSMWFKLASEWTNLASALERDPALREELKDVTILKRT